MAINYSYFAMAMSYDIKKEKSLKEASKTEYGSVKHDGSNHVKTALDGVKSEPEKNGVVAANSTPPEISFEGEPSKDSSDTEYHVTCKIIYSVNFTFLGN